MENDTVAAAKRLKVAYFEGLGNDGWRGLAELVGVNVSYVYNLAMKSVLPANPEIRAALLKWRPPEPRPVDVTMELVQRVMRTEHVGKAMAIRTRDLLDRLGGIGDRKLRACVEAINHDHGGLICSSPWSGYWWSAGMQDLDAVEAAFHRAKTQLENASHLRRNIVKEYGGQMPLLENVPETS